MKIIQDVSDSRILWRLWVAITCCTTVVILGATMALPIGASASALAMKKPVDIAVGRARDYGPPRNWCVETASTCSLNLYGHAQERRNWCVPASVQALSRNSPDQQSLARMLLTGAGGTMMWTVPHVLEQITGSPYRLDSEFFSYANGDDLLTRLRHAIGADHRSVLLGVEGDRLPYWPDGYAGKHVIVANGWSGHRVRVWDPLDMRWNTAVRGFHEVDANDLAYAGDGNMRIMLW